VLASLLVCWSAVTSAAAESIAYTARVGQEARLGTVTVASVEGQPSVSLKGLVTAFGGQVKVSSNSIQVALLDRAATLTVGDTEVAAPQKFTLQHAPRIYENDIYIAVSDVVSFFMYAFNLEVKTGQSAAPSDPAAAPTAPAGQKWRVVLDAGHGGTDPGASGQSATPEKTITRAIAQRVAKLIEASCQHTFTRTEDQPLAASDRVTMANVALKGDVLVSIHVGASASKTASGFEFFCPMGTGDANSSRGLALARSISNGMAQSTGATPRGVYQAPCRIFTNLQVPGVLVEVGFITNPTEEKLLVNAEYQEKLAQGIANGIVAYAGAKTQ
jgi:N-acetylmuramoyl-L-alanine amidase